MIEVFLQAKDKVAAKKTTRYEGIDVVRVQVASFFILL